MLENQELQEGINDAAIFKAVFLAGGPGSGKSFIGTETKGKSPTAGGDPKVFMGGGQLGLISLGLRVVNPDPAYEKMLKDAGLDAKNSADIWSDKGQEIRVKATDLTAKQKSLYVDGRLGVIVDGTGANINKVKGQKSLLDKVGYECAMIYVNTNLETAIARDQKRDRTIGADKVTEMWKNVQKNLKQYESIFGKSNMYVIDNSDGSNWQTEAKKAHKKLEKWIRKDPSDPKAKAWIEGQKMRNAPKSGIKEEDSNYLPGYSSGFYGHDPYTPRSRMQELHYDIRRCSSINDACNEVSDKWHAKLAELSKLNATHLDDLDDEDIAILLPYAEEMRQEQLSLEEGFSVELDENFIAFDLEHEVLTHFQTKADGMKWKNHKNAPDSYYLVKTKHRLLKGDMASEGSDSLSKHLDSQPFPHKDGPHFSVHKESVELDEKYDSDKFFGGKGTPEQRLQLIKLQNKALRALGGSPNQKEIRKEIDALRKKMGMKVSESVELDEVFGAIGLGFIASTLIKVAATTLMGAIIGGEIATSRKKSAGWTARPRRENSILDLISDKATLKTMQKKYPEALEMIGKNKDIINYSKNITSTKGGPDKEQMQTLKKMIKDEFEKSGISWSDFISSVEPLVRKSVKDAKKKMDESVELDESVYDKKLAQAWKKVKSVPNIREISNSGQNHAKKLSALLKGSPDKLTFEKLELALGTYETHAYKAAEDKKNPHGKEDLPKLEEFSSSVDDVIGAMKNLHQSQLPEGFMDTILGKNKKNSGNPEQTKISTDIDRKLKLIDGLMKKVKPLGGKMTRLTSFRKTPIEKMTPKDLYRALNDWYLSIDDYLTDNPEVDKRHGSTVVKLYDVWEEVADKIQDYMWASGYNVKTNGPVDVIKRGRVMVKRKNIDYSAPKRTDPEWLKMNEYVELDEKAPKIDMKKYAAHMDRNKKKKTMSSTKKNLSDISKRADKMSRESVELDEQRDFVSESAEMMMRDLVVMQNKIEDLLDSMEEEIGRPTMEEYDIEPWIVSKVTKSRDYIDTVYDWILMDDNDD